MRMPSSPLFHLAPRNLSTANIIISRTLVFKRKFIKVKHQNLDVALVGVA